MPKPSLRLIKGSYNGLGQKILFARRSYINTLIRHPEVRAFAENAIGRGSRLEQARRLFFTLRDVVNYVGDCVGIETTKAPWVMVDEIKERGFTSGDCDDQATLNYVLLKSVGIPAMFRVGWYGKPVPQHIYVVARLNGQWVPFDTVRSTFGTQRTYTKVRDIA